LSKKKEIPVVEGPKKIVYLVKESDGSEEEGIPVYMVYETVDAIEMEGEVLIYEFKTKANLKITNVLEPFEE